MDIDYGVPNFRNALAIRSIWRTILKKVEQTEGGFEKVRREKRMMLGAGVVGFGVWGVAGLFIGGWEVAGLMLVAVGLIACVAFTFGTLWRYFTLDE